MKPTDLTGRGLLLTAIVLTVTTLAGCLRSRGAEVHILTEGFSGPVVIVYGVAGGAPVPQDERGARVYRIPRSGILLVNLPPRQSGMYHLAFLVEAGDGTRREIPHSSPTPSDPSEFQAFGLGEGATTMIDARDVGEVRYQSYVIGVPSQRADWIDLRQQLEGEAVRQVVSARDANPSPARQ